jgi:alpha-tubulin suppressor-like RCC1 family protein
MNVTELTNALHTKINSSTNLDQILLLSKAVERLKLGNVNVVSTFSELSAVDFDLAAYGSLYFVESQSQLYISSGPGIWVSILKSNDIVAYGWGNNQFGGLGDGTTTLRSSPVSIVGGITNWTQIVSGTNHTLTIRVDGTAWAWGNNQYGKLGDGTVNINRSSPVSVVGGYTDWVQVSAGERHSLGVRANGTAWAWGVNSLGNLGDGTTTTRSSPVSVIGGFIDWTQLSGGILFSLGVRANGTIWGWGSNSNGTLGDGTSTYRLSPVSTVGGFTDWTQVSAGSAHALGLRANGTAWGWGQGAAGQLGNNSSTNRSSPVSVIGGFTDWVQVSTNTKSQTSLGLRATGSAWAWGYNNLGQIGDNTTVNKSSPVSVVGGFTDWVQVSGGEFHTLGIRTNGTAWAWGNNTHGQLGSGTTVNMSSPVSVIGGFTDWVQVSAGSNNSLAIRNNNRL